MCRNKKPRKTLRETHRDIYIVTRCRKPQGCLLSEVKGAWANLNREATPPLQRKSDQSTYRSADPHYTRGLARGEGGPLRERSLAANSGCKEASLLETTPAPSDGHETKWRNRSALL